MNSLKKPRFQQFPSLSRGGVDVDFFFAERASHCHIFPVHMIRNYLRVTFRNALRNRAFALINIAGLAAGIAVCLLIILFLRNEFDYDLFHEKGERIYRVLRVAEQDGAERTIGVTSAPFAPALVAEYPASVEAAVRVVQADGLVTVGEKSFTEKQIILADGNFFSIFSFPLTVGAAGRVLATPNSIVVSQETAQRYFGNGDPIGQRITIDHQYEFVVTGVFAKPARNSHLSFDMVGSLAIFREARWFTDWWSNGMLTYLLLKPGASPQAMNQTFQAFMDRHFSASFRKTGRSMNIRLEPLHDIYFDNLTGYDFAAHGDRVAVMMFAAVAAFILILSCINFMNLATARASGRAKEIGVRKVIGARRKDLVLQFVGEGILYTALATVLGLLIVEVALPLFNNIIGRSLSLSDIGPATFLLLPLIVVCVGVLAGSYPALFLSTLPPVTVLKERSGKGSAAAGVRRALVVFQFTISIGLMICTAVIIRQLDFVQNMNLGFDKDQVVLIRMDNSEVRENRERFRTEALRSPGVQVVSAMSGEPGGFHDNFTFRIEGRPGPDVRMRTVFTDQDYVRTFGLTIVAGRDFDRGRPSDATGVILNETAVRMLGWDAASAPGKQMVITLRDSVRRTVIGVVGDYHFTSLKTPVEPLAISIAGNVRVFALRIDPRRTPDALAGVEAAWQHAAPGYPFSCEFLDQTFARQYRAEREQRTLFGAFAAVSISIACLGLFGLAAFNAEQRTKEIGIRKVLGASVSYIVRLLAWDHLRLVLVAMFVAIPVGYYVMSLWLRNFAYRTDIGPDMIAEICLLAMLIALATVSYQAVRAACADPVKSLRYE